MSTTPLFDHDESSAQTPLAQALKRLAEQNIYLGTSSWKYEGWFGQVYSQERYLARGKFSKRKFNDTCLAEYAATFPVVCGDFSFYQFPSEQYWSKLFRSAPETLLYAFKAPEHTTVKVYPTHARYGARAGKANPSFLDARFFAEAFLRPLEAYRRQVAAVIFEFGTFSKKSYAGPVEFVADLEKFLGALPEAFRYSVEIRNPEYLVEEYFACLRRHRVAHVFNAWSRMPELGVQMEIPEAFTTDFTLTRALLRRGRSYEQAVKVFFPYESVQEEYPAARLAMAALIERARTEKQAAFVFVNNRLEGNAPGTIAGVLEELD